MRQIFVIAALLIPFCLQAQGPATQKVSGSVGRSGFSIGKCNISSMAVKYELSTYMGEPTVGSNLKWTKSYSTADDCLAGESFEIFIKSKCWSLYRQFFD